MLYIVGTPIGNLSDMSIRAIETLKSVDFIAAEDTRVTIKLLNHFDIQKPMISYYEHNIREKGQYIIDRIKNGENCAIVSDAGMPCISDPGEDLIRLCAEQGVEIVVIPGPSAVISALTLSGLKTSRFTFEGFLTVTQSGRIAHLKSLINEERTMIFYEAPHKLTRTLADMYTVLGDRKISIAREITKIYEQVVRIRLSEAVAYYKKNPPRGEFVLVIEGCEPQVEEFVSLEQATLMAKAMVEDGQRATDVAKEIAKAYGFKKTDIYKALL